MKLLCWSPPSVQHPDVIPFAWSQCQGVNPVIAADRATPTLRARAVKTLFLWKSVEGFLTKYSQKQLTAAPPPMDAYASFFERYFARLRANGVRLDFVITDIEDFPLPQPGDVLLTPGEFQAAKRHIGLAIRRGIYEPLNDPSVGMSNWESCVPRFWEVIDLNGWSFAPGDYSISGVTSMPLYPVQYGKFYRQNGFAHDVLWNSFVVNLNNTLACSGGVQMPWISYPSFAEKGERRPINAMRWIWNEQLKHLAVLGVSHCLLWNPERDDDAYVARCLHELNGQKPATPAADVPPAENAAGARAATTRAVPVKIQPDCDVVVTGNVTSKYADFLTALAKDGMEPNPKP